jgi:hypothetical protein
MVWEPTGEPVLSVAVRQLASCSFRISMLSSRWAIVSNIETAAGFLTRKRSLVQSQYRPPVQTYIFENIVLLLTNQWEPDPAPACAEIESVAHVSAQVSLVLSVMAAAGLFRVPEEVTASVSLPPADLPGGMPNRRTSGLALGAMGRYGGAAGVRRADLESSAILAGFSRHGSH